MLQENTERLLADIDTLREKYPELSATIQELRGKIDRMGLLSVVSTKVASIAGIHAMQQPQCDGGMVLSVIAGSIAALAYTTAKEHAAAYERITWKRDRLIQRFSRSLNSVLAGSITLRQKASEAGLNYEDIDV